MQTLEAPGCPLLVEGNPAEATDEQCYQAALDWANMLRGEYGAAQLDELPSGVQGSASACPLAHALADALHDGTAGSNQGRYSPVAEITFGREGRLHQIACPKLVNEFMIRFDHGRYPEMSTGQLPPFISFASLRFG